MARHEIFSRARELQELGAEIEKLAGRARALCSKIGQHGTNINHMRSVIAAAVQWYKGYITDNAFRQIVKRYDEWEHEG